MNKPETMRADATVGRLAYSPTELSQALGVSRQHIFNLIRRGEIQSTRLGTARRISAKEVARLLGDDGSE